VSTTPDPAPAQNGASEPDAALDHVVKNLFDAELEQWAFGRPQSDLERRRAAAAAAELTRRAENAPARRGDLPPGDFSAAPVNRELPDRPWWRRSAAVIGAAVLLVIGAASLAPTLTTSPLGPGSLDEFAREPSAAELELRTQLQREGLRVSVTPRIIAERDGAQVIAYRFITTSPTERPRNEVCLLLLETRALGAPVCVDRLEFLRDGMLATLPGDARRYVVLWGPTGGPEVSVISAEQVVPEYPASPAAEAFLSGPQSDADLAYADSLRALYPDDRLIVRVLATTPTWDAVGTLVATFNTGLWSYCVHLFDRSADTASQLGARVTCSGREPFERDGLVAQARHEGGSISLEWRPDDTVTVTETGGP
jgi:hypothetical protein